MKARQAEIQQKHARKIGEKSKAARVLKASQAKRKKQNHMQSVLDLPEIADDFPTMLELTVIDRLQAGTIVASVQSGVV